MFARTYLGAFEERASLSDEIILQSSASPCASDEQSIAAERIPEMPSHIGELYAGFFPQFESLGIICGEIGVYREKICRYV